MEIFFDRSEQVNHPKVRYDFRILNQNFQHMHATHSSAHASKFSFSKNCRRPKYKYFFYENWHAASFYIKEQTQKYKFEIRLLKSTILDPLKKAFLVFEENPPKICFSCFSFDSVLKTLDAQMFFWSVFLKTHKKSY